MFKIENNVIQIIRGDTGRFNIEVLDAAGAPYPLSAKDRLVFTVKKNIKSQEILIQKEGTPITLEPEDTSNLDFGKYIYDVQLTLEDGTVDTIIAPSTFNILSEVTW